MSWFWQVIPRDQPGLYKLKLKKLWLFFNRKKPWTLFYQNNNPQATRTSAQIQTQLLERYSNTGLQSRCKLKYMLPLLNMAARKVWNKWQEHKLFSTAALKAALQQKEFVTCRVAKKNLCTLELKPKIHLLNGNKNSFQRHFFLFLSTREGDHGSRVQNKAVCFSCCIFCCCHLSAWCFLVRKHFAKQGLLQLTSTTVPKSLT